jgi:hypothetical protein
MSSAWRITGSGHRHLAHEPLERHQIVAGDRPLELRVLDRRRLR